MGRFYAVKKTQHRNVYVTTTLVCTGMVLTACASTIPLPPTMYEQLKAAPVGVIQGYGIPPDPTDAVVKKVVGFGIDQGWPDVKILQTRADLSDTDGLAQLSQPYPFTILANGVTMQNPLAARYDGKLEVRRHQEVVALATCTYLKMLSEQLTAQDVFSQAGHQCAKEMLADIFPLAARKSTGIATTVSDSEAPRNDRRFWSAEFRLQFNYGPKELVSVTYSNGSRSSLGLGTHMGGVVGASIIPLRSGSHGLDLTVLAGGGGWNTSPSGGTSNDQIQVLRYTGDLLAYYRFEPNKSVNAYRIGGGLTYHWLKSLDGTGRLNAVNADLDNAMGFVGELGMVIWFTNLSIRYTHMKVHIPSANASFDASSFGATLGFSFPGVFNL